jgi:hypothetical protein
LPAPNNKTVSISSWAAASMPSMILALCLSTVSSNRTIKACPLSKSGFRVQGKPTAPPPPPTHTHTCVRAVRC